MLLQLCYDQNQSISQVSRFESWHMHNTGKSTVDGKNVYLVHILKFLHLGGCFRKAVFLVFVWTGG